jgi:RAB protein geranylgeranyltransferase component A
MRYLRASLVFCAVTSAVELRSRYDVVVVGSGLKESLLASLLASHGKEVLQVEPTSTPGGESASRDLQQLAERTDGPGSRLSEQRVGDAADYSVERSPKMFMASGTQLQLLVASGAWQHMTPPGFKRVQRSLLYRRRPDGKADVHRVLANSEDVLKTRMLTALEKARVVQFYLWVEKYDETDPRTHSTGPLSKRRCTTAPPSNPSPPLAHAGRAHASTPSPPAHPLSLPKLSFIARGCHTHRVMPTGFLAVWIFTR